MRAMVLGALCALGLAGCSEQVARRDAQRAAMEAAQEVSACEAQYPRGLQRAQCVSSAEMRQFGNGRDGDLHAIRAAKRVQLAEAFSSGKLSRADADVQWAMVNNEMRESQMRRNQAARDSVSLSQVVSAADRTANAANLNANLGLMNLGAQMMQGPARVAPSQTTCMRTGMIVNCNTY